MSSYLALSPSPRFIFAFCQSLIYANIIRLSLLSIQTDLHSRHSLLTYTASLSLSDSYTTYIYIVFPLSHTYTNTYIQVQHLSLKYLPKQSLSLIHTYSSSHIHIYIVSTSLSCTYMQAVFLSLTYTQRHMYTQPLKFKRTLTHKICIGISALYTHNPTLSSILTSANRC